MFGIQNVQKWAVGAEESHLRAVAPYMVGQDRLAVERELQKRGDRQVQTIRQNQTP